MFIPLRNIPFFAKLGVTVFGTLALILIAVGVITFQFVTSKTGDILKGQILPLVQSEFDRYHEQFQILLDNQLAQSRVHAEMQFTAEGNFLANQIAKILLSHAEEFDIDGIQTFLQEQINKDSSLIGVVAIINEKDQYSVGKYDNTETDIFTAQTQSNYAKVRVEVYQSNRNLSLIFDRIAEEQNLALHQINNTHAALLTEVNQQIQMVQSTNVAFVGQWLAVVGIGGLLTLFSFLMLIMRRLMTTFIDLEEQSQLILSSVHDGIVGVDQNSQTIFVNSATSSLLGYTKEELYRKSLHALIHYAYRDGHEHGVEDCPVFQTSRDGKPRKVEDDVLWRKDGTFIPVEYTTTPIYRENKLIGSVMVFHDITERKSAENALREASFQQQAIFDAATIGVAFIQDRIFQKCNTKFYELVGYSQEELIGQTTRCLYLNEDVYSEIGLTYAELKNGGIHHRTQELQRKDGSRFWCCMSGSSFVPSDISHGTVWTFRDVTLEREALESLQHGKEMAEAAMHMKSAFLANMGHEIRTPMNAIIGLSHLVLETELTAHQRDSLQRIEGSGQHLQCILENILDLSKIEAGKMTLEQSEFELSKILDVIVNATAEKSHAKRLKFFIVVDPAVPNDLIGDSSQLKRILVNYVDNAIKFTERGEIHLHVDIREKDDRSVLLHCAVRDTGSGLTEEQQHQLFLDFSQVDTSSTRRFGGIGMGLILSKRLAESMGGEVGVTSVFGQGSTFWFTARLGRGTEKPYVHTNMTIQAPVQMLPAITPPNLLIDPEQVRKVCENLIAFLVDEDFEANRIFEANTQLLKAAFGDGDYREIEDGIRQFDFERAFRVLTRSGNSIV